MLKIINHEFSFHNAIRAYPFAEDAARTSSIGEQEIRIPDDFLLGCKLSLAATPEQVNPANFYVSRLSVYPHGASVVISHYGDDGSITEVAVVLITFDSGDDCFSVLEVVPTNNFYNLTGHIEVGTGKNLLKNLGEYLFDVNATRFDLDCIEYTPKCITSVVVESDGQVSEPIYGDIVLRAGNNVRLDTAVNNGRTEIIVSAEFSQLDTAGILTINGVGADESGNINIVSLSDCLQITSETAQINLTDTCASPCCGCDELQEITSNHEILVSVRYF